MDVLELFTQACELPEQDRAELAALLIESLDVEPDAATEKAWAREIGRTE